MARRHGQFQRYGTPYMTSPEALKYVCYEGSQGDIWALGLILFSMATGRDAFSPYEE